jgi:hypothetical protein
MLRNVIVVKGDDEESIKMAIKEILRTKQKGHEVSIDLSRIQDLKRKTEIIRRLSRY